MVIFIYILIAYHNTRRQSITSVYLHKHTVLLRQVRNLISNNFYIILLLGFRILIRYQPFDISPYKLRYYLEFTSDSVKNYMATECGRLMYYPPLFKFVYPRNMK